MSEIKTQTSRLRENWNGLKSAVQYVTEINKERVLRWQEKFTGKLETSAVRFLGRINAVLEKAKHSHDFLLEHRNDIIKIIQTARTYAEKAPLHPTVKRIIELARYLEEYLQRQDTRGTINQVITA